MTKNPDSGGMISIIVPTYKEAENLPLLMERIGAAMDATGRRWEVVVVDDDSEDGVESVCLDLSHTWPNLRLVVRMNQRGLSSAVIRGFREARGQTLVCMDADLSHPPEALPELVSELEDTDADFVIGSRYVPGGSTEEGWGLWRWINSKAATLLARPFTRVKDPMAGFFALRRRTFESADTLNPIGYKIGLELIVKCRCRSVHEIPIHFSRRRYGHSKLTFREQLNYLKHIKRLAVYRCRSRSGGSG